MDHEQRTGGADDVLRPLSEFVESGPMAYSQFLVAATLLSEQIAKAHGRDTAFGTLDMKRIRFDGFGYVALPHPQSANGDCSGDLQSLGKVFYHLLVGKPIPERSDANTLRMIHPSEARVVVEKLLGLHASGQFMSAAELHASLVLMRDMHETSLPSSQTPSGVGSIRLRVTLSLIVLALIIIWVLVALLRK